ncbi:MAG: TlpA family protein disulfide reductase [Bacteroidales bacterium]|nr:TlpA family protein disulfide reductase [Bacteroidales bacterium]
MKKLLLTLSLATLLLTGCMDFQKNLPQGPWLGVIRIDSTVSDMDLPFNMVYEKNIEIEVMYVLNADETIFITEIDRVGDSVFMKFPVFASEIACEFRHDSLVGRYYPKGVAAGTSYAFYATPGVEERFPWFDEEPINDVTGRWSFIENPGTPDSSVMVGEFTQNGSRVTGTILNPTGDYRFLEGKVSGNRFMLSAIDGAHTLVLTAEISPDGTLENGKFMGSPGWKSNWRAVRDEEATIPRGDRLIRLKPDAKPFTFAFPDINGDTVSLTDAGFKDKVVIVQAVGTWCPNCLDEAVFYRDIYTEYKDQGLEIVALSFEDKTFEASVPKMKRFAEQTGVGYPLLYAGPRGRESIRAVLYPFEGIMAYPTTIFIDKKGKIRKVETGFSGPGTGEHFDRYVDETRGYINELLKEE